MNGAAVDAPVRGTSTGDIMVLGTPKTPVTSFQAREPRIGRNSNSRPVSLEAFLSAVLGSEVALLWLEFQTLVRAPPDQNG